MKKKCTNPECEQPVKDVSQFHISRISKDGLQCWCKACTSISNKKSYQANREHVLKRQSQLQKEKSALNIKKREIYQQELIDKGLKKCSSPGCAHPMKNISEFSTDKKRKDGLNCYCRSCQSEISKGRYNKHSEKRRQYRLLNRDRINHRKREHYKENIDRINKRQKEWNAKNPNKLAARNAKRNAAKLNRTVEWANLKKIAELYWVARTLTVRTGIKWVVDHKIPLQGKNVSGLHVENNLQVITDSRNGAKNNKFTPIWGVA